MLDNKTIYDAMTIKLTAEDIPMEIPNGSINQKST